MIAPTVKKLKWYIWLEYLTYWLYNGEKVRTRRDVKNGDGQASEDTALGLARKMVK